MTGTAPGDMSGYNLTITADEPEMAYQVSSLAALTGITFVNV
jgi:hypothetical protein